MRIIIDTREQKPLEFKGHEIVRKKLDEGDYNVEELQKFIVIERKSLQDFYGSVITGHRRFRDEIIRSRLQGKTFYLFLEGTLKDFYSLKWCKYKRYIKIPVLIKIVSAMQEKYQMIVIECESREKMSELILATIEMNKKLYEVNKMVDVTTAMESDSLNVDIVRESPTKKCVILDEGSFEEKEFDGKKVSKLQLNVEIDGKRKKWLPNRDTVKNIAAIYGRESKLWGGKIIQLQIVKILGKDAVMGIPIPMPQK